MKVKLVQFIIIIIPLAVLGWLFNKELVISGEFVTKHDVTDRSAFVDQLLPDSRVENGNTIIDDPVFFFLHPHRDFDEIELEIVYKNNSVPIIELGGLASTKPEAYTFTSLENKIIDESNWDRIESDGQVLLQREKQFESIDEFLSDSSSRKTIATYRAELEQPYRDLQYQPTFKTQTIAATLRGHHEFKTYIKNEKLNFVFEYMDMNREDGQDPVSIVVFNEDGQPVTDAKEKDDGNISANAKPSELRRITLEREGLSEGVYKVVLNINRDIFVRNIKTTQQHIAFLNRVYLGDEVGYREPARSVSFWTNGKHPSFQTRNAEGVQVIKLAGEFVEMNEPYVLYRASIPHFGVVPITVPKSNTEIFIDGMISFSSDQYFNPDPVRLLYNTDLDALEVDYIFAQYKKPEQRGDWNVAKASFKKDELLMDKKSWKITFSTPGIAELGASLQIKEINVIWKRSPFRFLDIMRFLKD